MLKRFVPVLLVVLSVVWVAPGVHASEISVESPSAVLMDAITGECLYAKNEDVQRAPASLTKIMTLVVAFDAIKTGRVKPDDRAMASEKAAGLGGTQVYARVGEVFPLSEWILAVAVGSANDASVVVAEHIAGTEEAFVKLMNEKARELGMKNTEFMNSHGLDADRHHTTAYDLALLARHAVTVPELLELTSTYQAKFRNDTFGLDNVNKMVRLYTGCDGLKTGRTNQSKYCLVTTAFRQDQRFIGVVLGAETSDIRFSDGRKLLDYGFANFSSVLFAEKGEGIENVRVWGGSDEYVSTAPAENVAITVRKDAKSQPEQRVTLSKDLKAPVKKGDVVGSVDVLLDDAIMSTTQLLAATDIPKVSFVASFGRMLAEIMRMGW